MWREIYGNDHPQYVRETARRMGCPKTLRHEGRYEY
jgi:hypothetical protein